MASQGPSTTSGVSEAAGKVCVTLKAQGQRDTLSGACSCWQIAAPCRLLDRVVPVPCHMDLMNMTACFDKACKPKGNRVCWQDRSQNLSALVPEAHHPSTPPYSIGSKLLKSPGLHKAMNTKR